MPEYQPGRRDSCSGSLLLVAFSSLALLMLTFASVGYALSGNDNYGFYPINSSYLNLQDSISTSISASNPYGGPLLGCGSISQWSYQWNIWNPDYSVIQEIVEVNPLGYSCFSVQYWPPFSSYPDYYSINIGYTNQFIQSGNTVNFWLDLSNWKVTDFRVSVPSDSWIIYPSQLTHNPTIVINSGGNSQSQLIMVGCCGSASASFTGGAGTEYYYNVVWSRGAFAISAESSNMVYNSVQFGSNYYYNTFTG